MQLQTFHGSTMAEAYQRVKTTLGPDAVILHTRTVNHRRWLGLRRVERFEITAGRGVNVIRRELPKRPAPTPAPRPAPKPVVTAPKPQPQAHPQLHPLSPPKTLLDTHVGGAVAVIGLTTEVNQLKEIVTDLVTEVRKSKCPDVPEELIEQYTGLIENMVAAKTAVEIVVAIKRELRPEMLTNKAAIREKLAEHLAKLIPTSGPIERKKTTGPHIIALIGPTGVGKTTTIAKLAANLKLRDKRRVGLITLDTFRIAAVDQLQRYADILQAPLKTVLSPHDMKAALAGFADYDFVLIDTAGRSPKDALKLVELKQFLNYAEPDEVYLVLSTTSSEDCVDLAVEKFGEVRVDKLIFTKIDEAAQLGVVLNVAHRVKKGLAYVTTGQNVPDDIEEGHGRRLANLILGSP